jgi:hypothetical protein
MERRASKPALLDGPFVQDQLGRLEAGLRRASVEGAATREGGMLEARLVSAISAALRTARADPDEGSDPGEYYSRSPIVSLAQSAIDEAVAKPAEPAEAAPADVVRDRGDDVDVAAETLEILLSNVWRFVHGKHRFCQTPADVELEDDARLVIVSDWGSGRDAARRVAGAMRARVDQGIEQHRPVHVVHLGDNYYSGTQEEARRNILGLWPVRPDEADEIGSWCLMGNHDMYSGGDGFFETVLGDPRFKRQVSPDGERTSWFRLRTSATEGWTVAGLDTAWHDPLIEFTHGNFTGFGLVGHLEDPQADVLTQWAREDDRRLLVLSHHQLFTRYDSRQDVGERMLAKLRACLHDPGVDVWFWGHEHDCLAYRPYLGVGAARAIGHGALQYAVRRDDAPAMPGHPEVVGPPEGEPGDGSDGRAPIAWDYRGSWPGDDGRLWLKNGFAVVDLDGGRLAVTYVDDENGEYFTETL